ncbi:MAG: protein phosphatase 2C domain-containing protein [Candidatus Solibacter sp.]|jgi:serine/threonine protein phosphatase PrpC
MTERSLDCGAATDIGQVRERNEDRYWMDPARGAFLVVDGVGGQAAGERAAEIAVAAIRAQVGHACQPAGRPAMEPTALVREAIAAANNGIYAAALKDPALAGMACVLTLALVEGQHVTVGHVGDSRLYLIGPGAIRKVTSDHSPVGEVEDAGEIGEEEAMAHPRRHEVFRDVGSCPRSAGEEEFIEVFQCELPNDAAMLLCSDGLSDHLTSRRIREIAERYAGDAAQTARNLVDAANQAGGRDNITALFVAGPAFGGGSAATRPRLGITRIRPRRRVWSGRVAFLSYGVLLGMLLWAALRIRG